MQEEIEKLKEMRKLLQTFMDKVYLQYKALSREVVLSAMVIKKTMDILSVSEYTLKNYIISVQISHLRLLCDNCLAIQAARELGIETYLDMIQKNLKTSNVMVTEEQNMSDGYLKRLVSKEYSGFDKLYNFACEGVHFSKQAISSAFVEKDGKTSLNLTVGNKDYKEEMKYNNKQMIVLCKVIIDMLRKTLKIV